MDLIDDINLICRSRRCKINFLEDGSYVVNTVIGCCVHLGNVQDGTVKDTPAGRTLVARIAVNGVLAVDRPGKDLGDRGLACAVLAAEKISVSEFLRYYRLP